MKAIGRNVTGVRGDAANLDDLDRLFDTVRREKGKIDVLYASAGTGEAVLLGEISEPPNPQHATYRRIGERVGRAAAHFLVVGTMIKSYRPGARAGGMDPARIVPAGETPGVAAAYLAEMVLAWFLVIVLGCV